MARFSEHYNAKVGRQQAEILQEKLFQAATLALDTAMSEQKVPGNLLSACQSILRDSGLSPDLAQSDEDAEEVVTGKGVDPKWLTNLQQEIGLPDL